MAVAFGISGFDIPTPELLARVRHQPDAGRSCVVLMPYITHEPARAIVARRFGGLIRSFGQASPAKAAREGRNRVAGQGICRQTLRNGCAMGVRQPMDEEDLQPQERKPDLKNLEVMSFEALEGYIGELESEIARVRAEIANKQSAKSAAESIFRK